VAAKVNRSGLLNNFAGQMIMIATDPQNLENINFYFSDVSNDTLPQSDTWTSTQVWNKPDTYCNETQFITPEYAFVDCARGDDTDPMK